MRKATLFTTVGAIVLVAAGATVRFYVAPSLVQLPADLDTTVRLTGTASMIDPVAIQSGDLLHAFRNNIPVTVADHVKVTSTSGQTAVVSDETTLTGPDN